MDTNTTPDRDNEYDDVHDPVTVPADDTEPVDEDTPQRSNLSRWLALILIVVAGAVVFAIVVIGGGAAAPVAPGPANPTPSAAATP